MVTRVKIEALVTIGGFVKGKVYEVGQRLASELIELKRAKLEGEEAPKPKRGRPKKSE